MIFIGYEPGTKAYRVYDPATRRVHISRDIVFDEGATWKWEEDEAAAAAAGGEFAVEFITTPAPPAKPQQEPAEEEADVQSSATVSPVAARPHQLTDTPPPVEFATPP
jgi:hypothetical protein